MHMASEENLKPVRVGEELHEGRLKAFFLRNTTLITQLNAEF